MKKMKTSNLIRLFTTLALLVICWAIVSTTIGAQFKTAGNPDSVDAFLRNFSCIFAVNVILMLIWWGFLLTSFTPLASIRTGFESHTFLCSILFCALAFVFTTLFYFHNHIISGPSGRYKLQCAFILPCFFTFLMYFRPPVHVRYVALPFRGFLYWAIRVVTLVLSLGMTLLLFYWNFIRG